LEHSTLIRVRYSETDKMGIVNNANYLNWFEVARTDFCRKLGKSYLEWESEGTCLPVVEAWCRYKNPAFYDDLLRIDVQVSELKRFSLTFSYRLGKEEDATLVAQGWTKHAIVDQKGKLIKGSNPFMDWIKIQVQGISEVE